MAYKLNLKKQIQDATKFARRRAVASACRLARVASWQGKLTKAESARLQRDVAFISAVGTESDKKRIRTALQKAEVHLSRNPRRSSRKSARRTSRKSSRGGITWSFLWKSGGGNTVVARTKSEALSKARAMGAPTTYISGGRKRKTVRLVPVASSFSAASSVGSARSRQFDSLATNSRRTSKNARRRRTSRR